MWSATEMRRDADRLFDEDNFQVIFDTFKDSRNGYMFLTTPLGAKLEQQIFDEGEGGGRGTTSNVNRNWEGVWDAAAKTTDFGWSAEIAIPTNTLRFRPTDEQTWGINFLRHIRRKNELVYWAPIPRAYTLTRVSLAGELRGLQDLSLGWDLKLKPFVVAGPRRRELERYRLHHLVGDGRGPRCALRRHAPASTSTSRSTPTSPRWKWTSSR